MPAEPTKLMRFPILRIDLSAIRRNVRRMVRIGRAQGFELTGITKGVAGDPEIAQIFVDEGVPSLGDSRLENLRRLRAAGIDEPLWLIRSPAPDEAGPAVELAEGSLTTEPSTLQALSNAALRHGEPHRILLMLDLDTGREGIAPQELDEAIARIDRLKGLRLTGVGLYFDFQSAPTLRDEAFSRLEALMQRHRSRGLRISGGASNVFHQCTIDGTPPVGVNHLRLGTAPLLGLGTSHGPAPIDGWDRDTFVLTAPVIETKSDGERCLVALGTLDAPCESLFPVDASVRIDKASSDHLMLRCTHRRATGEVVHFRLGYAALARLMTSPYTHREYTTA